MIKQYTVILGLSFSLALTACAKSTDAPQAEQATPETSQTQQSPESRSPRAGQGPRAGQDGRPGSGGRGGREGRTPPEAAYAACDNRDVQSVCTVETPRGTREGVCRIREGDERTVCMPSRSEGRRPEGRRDEGRRNEGGRPRRSGQ